MKAFNRQIIQECSCARKENADRDILVTCRNGDIKIIQFIRITSRMNIYQSNIYRKDLSWLHFKLPKRVHRQLGTMTL